MSRYRQTTQQTKGKQVSKDWVPPKMPSKATPKAKGKK
jgi:hypothetical protein